MAIGWTHRLGSFSSVYPLVIARLPSWGKSSCYPLMKGSPYCGIHSFLWSVFVVGQVLVDDKVYHQKEWRLWTAPPQMKFPSSSIFWRDKMNGYFDFCQKSVFLYGKMERFFLSWYIAPKMSKSCFLALDSTIKRIIIHFFLTWICYLNSWFYLENHVFFNLNLFLFNNITFFFWQIYIRNVYFFMGRLWRWTRCKVVFRWSGRIYSIIFFFLAVTRNAPFPWELV